MFTNSKFYRGTKLHQTLEPSATLHLEKDSNQYKDLADKSKSKRIFVSEPSDDT